jgi:hypothetical protein
MGLGKSKHKIASGIICIIIGLVFLVLDLFPIYQSNTSGNWPKISGTVSKNFSPGFLHLRRHVTFRYRIGAKNYESTQMMPSNFWSVGLREGSVVPVRYCPDKPESALVDHPQDWGYVFLACWNSIWLIAGASFLFDLKTTKVTIPRA